MADESGPLLGLLAADPSVTCAMADFARDLQKFRSGQQPLHEAASLALRHYEAEGRDIALKLDQSRIAHDKLKAELMRVDAQMDSLAKQQARGTQLSGFCRIVISGLHSLADTASESAARAAPYPAPRQPSVSSVAAPTPVPVPTTQLATVVSAPPPTTATTSAPVARSASPNTLPDITGTLIAMLQVTDVKEASLLTVLQRVDQTAAHTSVIPWANPLDYEAALTLWPLLVRHLPQVRPPVQVLELRVLTNVAKRAAQFAPPGGRPASLLHECTQGDSVMAILRLLNSVNDDVKSEALELLAVIVAEDLGRQQFTTFHGIPPLINIISTSNSEPILERALILLWTAAISDEVKQLVLQQPEGLRSLLDLLFTDSTAILENVITSLGYLTRDEGTKVAVRECGGLEKLVATLLFPSESIQGKAAGAIWNCASNTENRVALRELGAIPYLIDLLSSPSPNVQENAAGALWNLAVDVDNKACVLEYNGLTPLVGLLKSPHDAIVENASGALWNCSATVENRAALRKLGAIPAVLSLLTHPNERVQENAAGAMRNIVINDQNKSAIREAGGVELVVDLLSAKSKKPTILEKLVSTLWILTVTPENKHALRTCNGLGRLVALLDHDNPSIREKALGTVRNCSTVAENRQPLVECQAIAALVRLGAVIGAGTHGGSSTAREHLACTLWNLSRDDKTTPRKEGAMKLLCQMLSDPHEGVVEQAAGALSTLVASSPENRDVLRELGGVDGLVRVAATAHNSFVLQNAYHALKYATTSCEPNQRRVAEIPGAIAQMVQVLTASMRPHQQPPVLAQATGANGAASVDDIIREVVFCLKNVAADRAAFDEVIRCGGLRALTDVADSADRSDTLKKAASMVAQLYARRP